MLSDNAIELKVDLAQQNLDRENEKKKKKEEEKKLSFLGIGSALHEQLLTPI